MTEKKTQPNEQYGKTGKWEKLQVKTDKPTIWNTKGNPARAGDYIEGTIESTGTSKFPAEKEEVERDSPYWIIANNGDRVQTPAHTQLIGLMGQCQNGDYVKIVFTGFQRLNTGRYMNTYEVFRSLP